MSDSGWEDVPDESATLNAKQVQEHFINKGYKPHHAAGIAANLVQESGLDPKAVNPKSGAEGLAQWLGPRKVAFHNYANATGGNPSDPMVQLDFVDYELNNGESNAKTKLLKTNNSTDATISFSNHFERAGKDEKNNARRVDIAQSINSQDNNEWEDVPKETLKQHKLISNTSINPQLNQPSSPQESFGRGFAKSFANKAMSDFANTVGAFGSHNPLAKLIGTDKIPSPADYIASKIKEVSPKVDETQPGTTLGRIASDILTTIPLGAEKLLPNIALGAAHGYATGEGDIGDRLQNAAIGGIGQGAGHLLGQGVKLIGKGAELAKRKFYPNEIETKYGISDLLKEAVPLTNRVSVAKNLINALPLIPGYKPIAAEAGQHTGLNALSKYAEGINPGHYGQRELNNMAARNAAVKSVSGTDQALKQAEEARKAITGPLYKAAENKQVEITPALSKLFKQPNMQDAIDQGITNLRNSGINVPTNMRNNIITGKTNIDTGLIDASGKPIIKTIPTEISGQHLDIIKKAMDDKLKDAINPITGAQRIAHIKTAKKFENWRADNINEYKIAQETHRAMSVPINQMRIGSMIENAGYPAIDKFGNIVEESPKSLTAMLVNPKLVKKATGISGNINKILTTDQQDTLTNVAKNMNRRELANVGIGGDFGQSNQGMWARAPGAIAESVSGIPGAYQLGAAKLMEKLSMANKDIKKNLAEVMLDPKKTASSLLLGKRPPILSSWSGKKESFPGIIGYILGQQANR
jgi:hypothetical protein